MLKCYVAIPNPCHIIGLAIIWAENEAQAKELLKATKWYGDVTFEEIVNPGEPKVTHWEQWVL